MGPQRVKTPTTSPNNCQLPKGSHGLYSPMADEMLVGPCFVQFLFI